MSYSSSVIMLPWLLYIYGQVSGYPPVPSMVAIKVNSNRTCQYPHGFLACYFLDSFARGWCKCRVLHCPIQATPYILFGHCTRSVQWHCVYSGSSFSCECETAVLEAARQQYLLEQSSLPIASNAT